MPCFSLGAHGHEASGGQTKTKSSDKLSVLNVVSPYYSPIGVGSRMVRRWCVGKGLWRKRKLSCNKVDRGLYPDTKVCRLPYGGSLLGNLQNFLERESK